MTPEERAEKIARELFASPNRQREAVVLIAAQIREAVEEWSAIVIPQAKAYAYEDAAKIVKQAMKDQDEYGLADGKWVLKEIRARKDEVCKLAKGASQA